MDDGEHVTFTCPFCGLECAAGSFLVEGEPVVGSLHALPVCPTFQSMEPDDFLAAVNAARAGD